MLNAQNSRKGRATIIHNPKPFKLKKLKSPNFNVDLEQKVHLKVNKVKSKFKVQTPKFSNQSSKARKPKKNEGKKVVQSPRIGGQITNLKKK